MPHLSPMNWLAAPLIIIFTLLCFSTILWWHFMPLFPPCATPLNTSLNPWKWW
uniref:ATP synthase F0 subunit 8 n=1 Tax=Nereis sp. TaxID=61854 RepID=A0A345WJR9_9ANNE|nr:ATP synthase F0 subunit 8 [Nereis sp.]